MKSRTSERAGTRRKPALLAKTILVDTLGQCCDALDKLDHRDDSSFAAAVQIALAGAGFSASELARSLGYDTGTVIKWYQGQMAPPRDVVRQEVVETLKVLVQRRLAEWQSVSDSAEGIRRINQRGRGDQLSLRWTAKQLEPA